MSPVRVCAVMILLGTLFVSTPGSVEAKPTLVRAAPAAGTATWSPRRLFNAALGAHEDGDALGAVRLFLAARLAARHSYADELYARGAGLRLVRVLAGYDDDAATAIALHVADEAGTKATTDLAPLIRTLVRRLDVRREPDLAIAKGRIAAIRYREADGAAIVDVLLPDGSRRVVAAHGPIGPFSAGDKVRTLIRRERHGDWAEWRLVAMSHAGQDGWALLAVEGLPSNTGGAIGTLIRTGR